MRYKESDRDQTVGYVRDCGHVLLLTVSIRRIVNEIMDVKNENRRLQIENLLVIDCKRVEEVSHPILDVQRNQGKGRGQDVTSEGRQTMEKEALIRQLQKKMIRPANES